MNKQVILNEKKNVTNYERVGLLLVFLLLAVSGMEYFYRSQYNILISFFIASFFFFRYKRKINKTFSLVVLLFLIVEAFQYILFGGFNMWTFSGSYIRLFLAFAVIAIVGQKFLTYYVKIMYFLAVVSLIFYAGSFLPGAENFYVNVLGKLIPSPFSIENDFYKQMPNIIIFNFEDTLFTENRNSGPFWEPGAFAVFILIALLFNQIKEKKFTTKKNIIFIICLITTFSTAGYLAFFIFIVYINIDVVRKNILYSTVFILILFSSFYLYKSIPFLKDKIENNINIADETTGSRFGSAQADLVYFIRSPIVGMGRAGAKNDFKTDFTQENHRNNGIFILLSTYGLPFTIVYIYLVFLSFSAIQAVFHLPKLYPFAAIIIVLILAFSQALFLKPFLNTFLFLPSIMNTTKSNKLSPLKLGLKPLKNP